VGSTLSSGLDSSSVSVMAANLLKKKGIRLPVFTSIPQYDCQQLIGQKRIVDEGPLAAKVVDHNGNMDHYLLKSENISVLEGIKKALWIHDQPVHASGNAYWIVDMMDKARLIGCSVLLTGQCGNATISWPTPAYYNWYISPRVPVINFKNLADWKLLQKNIIKPVLPNYIIKLARKIKKRFQALGKIFSYKSSFCP